jgi:Glycine zipper 2TM domain
VTRVKTVSTVLLLASMVSFQPAPVQALDGNHRDRFEDRSDDHDAGKHKKDKKDHWKAQRERREHRAEAREAYWDAARYYKRDDRRYRARRLGRNDWVYRGSDNRYYCRRDDGTTGLIIGGISGAVLGHIIAPGGAKTLGTIVGAGAGALIGRAIDDGDVVCR